jgi:hypothetical protein
MRAVLLLPALLASAMPVVANAGDYPYSGYFGSQPAEVSETDTRLACAYSFVHQQDDGWFVGYIIDKPAYDADGTIRYDEYARGRCTMAGALETCTMTASRTPDEIGFSYYDVIESIAADDVVFAMFDDLDSAERYAEDGEGESLGDQRFARCDGFEANIGRHLVEEFSTMADDDLWPLYTPDFTDEIRAEMMAILAAIAAGPAQ